MIPHITAAGLVLCVTSVALAAPRGGTEVPTRGGTKVPPYEVAQSAELVVNAASANVHKAPSIGSPVIGTAPRGVVLAITRELGDWVKVAWKDSKDGFGYVHLKAGTVARRTGTTSGRSTPRAMTTLAPRASDPQIDSRSPLATAPEYVSRPAHSVSVGGRMTGATFGFGATSRTWFRGPLGVEVDVSRSTTTSPVAPGRLTSTSFTSSVLYSFRESVTDYVWMRPYIGAGPTLNRHSWSIGEPGAAPSTANRFGVQAFGGAEFTFAAAPQLALSVDFGYERSRAAFDGFEPRKFGFAVGGHWYLR